MDQFEKNPWCPCFLTQIVIGKSILNSFDVFFSLFVIIFFLCICPWTCVFVFGMSDTNDPNNLEINPKNTVESGDQHGAKIVLVKAH